MEKDRPIFQAGRAHLERLQGGAVAPAAGCAKGVAEPMQVETGLLLADGRRSPLIQAQQAEGGGAGDRWRKTHEQQQFARPVPQAERQFRGTGLPPFRDGGVPGRPKPPEDAGQFHLDGQGDGCGA